MSRQALSPNRLEIRRSADDFRRRIATWINTMTHRTFPGITFGVELEFLSAGFDKPNRASERTSLDMSWIGPKNCITHDDWLAAWRRALGEEILRFAPGLPMAVKCYHANFDDPICLSCQGLTRKNGVAILSEGTDSLPTDVHTHYRYFLIKKEGLMYLETQLNWLCVEISSPIFDQQELLSGLPQIRRLITGIAEARTEIRANRSCGMHVHVGPRDGLRLLDTKKLVTLVMMLEHPLLYNLVASYREHGRYASSIRTSRFLAMYTAARRTHTLPENDPEGMREHVPWTRETLQPLDWNTHEPEECHDILRLVWEADSLWRLDKQLRQVDDERSGLAMCLRYPQQLEYINTEGYWDWDSDSSTSSNRSTPSKSTSDVPDFEGSRCSTVEFRFSQMTFDISVIKDWIALGCRLVEIASFPASEYSSFLDKLLGVLTSSEERSTSCKRRRILRLLGLGDQDARWSARCPRRDWGDDFIPYALELSSRPEHDVGEEDGLEDRMRFMRL